MEGDGGAGLRIRECKRRDKFVGEDDHFCLGHTQVVGPLGNRGENVQKCYEPGAQEKNGGGDWGGHLA